MKEKLQQWNADISEMPLNEKIEYILSKISGKKVFSTSFGIEDQVLIDIISKIPNNINVFTLDTGRQFNETYEVFQSTQYKYPNIKIETFFPDEKDIQEYVNEIGINGFYKSIENRKQCCFIRKIKPLNRAIKNADLWITGLRAEQSANRETMNYLEWDKDHKLIKFNPLIHHTLKEIEEYVNTNYVPISKLYKQGFLSIGCAPCTRALRDGEDFRAGRWWWENGKKECGLHVHSDKNN